MRKVTRQIYSATRRNMDFQSVRPAGLQPAEKGERRLTPLSAQGTALCSRNLPIA